MSVAIAEAHDESNEEGPFQHFELLDKVNRPNVFEGRLVRTESTETDQTRWTEIEAYKTTTGKWVVRVLGKSVEYHRHYSNTSETGSRTCNTGIPRLGKEMEDGRVPCVDCRPGDYRASGMGERLFNVEIDIPTIHSGNAAELVKSLRDKSRAGDGFSYVVSRLLLGLSKDYEDIRREFSKPRVLM
jgi:hypothetical protein